MYDIKIGVIGVGGAGKYHSNILKKLCKEVYVYDIRSDIAQKVANELRVKVCKSLDELLRIVDAAYVCTPPYTHEEVIKRICEEGKHIFCEKPLCVTVKEAERIVNYVKKSGVLFMMGFVLRFTGIATKVKELIEKGNLGDIINAWFFDVRPPYVLGIGGWRTRRKYNGGIFEQTVHEIDLIRWLVGEPATVYAVGGNYVLKEFDYEDNIVYLMKMKNNAITTLISSISAKDGLRDYGIVGSNGTIIVKGSSIYFNRSEITYTKWDPFEREDEYFIKCVKEGTRPFVNEIDGYRAQVLSLIHI